MDILSGDESDDGSSESSGLLEAARQLVPAAATGRGNILPRGAVRPEYAGGDDKMFYIIDGQWGIVLVKDVMPSGSDAPRPVPCNSKTARSKRAVPVDDRSPALPNESETMFHIIDGQWGTVLVKDVMPALKTPARNETTPALAKRKASVHVPYNRSPCGRMQIIEGQYASIQPGTTEVKFE